MICFIHIYYFFFQLPFEFPKSGVKGFFETIEDWWHAFWDGMVNFITGKSCRYLRRNMSTYIINIWISLRFNSWNLVYVPRKKCSGFFDFRCHLRYICMSWLLLFGLFLAIFPTGNQSNTYNFWIFGMLIYDLQKWLIFSSLSYVF